MLPTAPCSWGGGGLLLLAAQWWPGVAAWNQMPGFHQLQGRVWTLRVRRVSPAFAFVLLVCQRDFICGTQAFVNVATQLLEAGPGWPAIFPIFSNHVSELQSPLLLVSAGDLGRMLANLWPLVRGTKSAPAFLSSCLLVDLHSQKFLRNNS